MAPLQGSIVGLQSQVRYRGRLLTFRKVQRRSRKNKRFWALPFLRQGPGSSSGVGKSVCLGRIGAQKNTCPGSKKVISLAIVQSLF
jgi:hypothetical protein